MTIANHSLADRYADAWLRCDPRHREPSLATRDGLIYTAYSHAPGGTVDILAPGGNAYRFQFIVADDGCYVGGDVPRVAADGMVSRLLRDGWDVQTLLSSAEYGLTTIYAFKAKGVAS